MTNMEDELIFGDANEIPKGSYYSYKWSKLPLIHTSDMRKRKRRRKRKRELEH